MCPVRVSAEQATNARKLSGAVTSTITVIGMTKFSNRVYQILTIVAVALGPIALVWHSNATRFERFLYGTSILPLSLILLSVRYFSSRAILLREPDTPGRQKQMERERAEYRRFLILWIFCAPLVAILLWDIIFHNVFGE